MRVTDWIVSTTLLDGGASVSKQEIVHQLLLKLAEGAFVSLPDVPALQDAVLRRESLGSTGIGQGVAIPHTKSTLVARPLAILAVCGVPVDFDSIDQEPVDIIVLCLSPRDLSERNRRESIRWSEFLVRQLAGGEFQRRLRQATSAEQIMEVLNADDQAEA